MAKDRDNLKTPDGRYIVVRGRLWRATNPSLAEHTRQQLVDELMNARRMIRDSKHDLDNLTKGRRRVHEAKVALGERGAVWWKDDTPDLTRHMAKNTPYADWYKSLVSN